MGLRIYLSSSVAILLANNAERLKLSKEGVLMVSILSDLFLMGANPKGLLSLLGAINIFDSGNTLV